MELTFTQALMLALFLPFVYILGFVVKKKKRVIDYLNLRFRRSRCIKVNFITRTQRNIERFVVPNAHGIFFIDGGGYIFRRERSIMNSDLRIPEINIAEGQIVPLSPRIGVDFIEREVEVNREGTMVKETMAVPQFFSDLHDMDPKAIDGKIAKELHEILKSDMADRVAKAGSNTFKKIDTITIMIYAILAILLIGGIILYGKVDSAQDAVTQLGFQVGGGK